MKLRAALASLFALLFPSGVRAQLPDPTTIPADQRIAAVNKLSESREGTDTDRNYQRALELYRATHDREAFGVGVAAEGAPPGAIARAEADSKAGEWIWDNTLVLACRFDWPPERTAHVDRWLKANAGALSAFRQAATGTRWHRPLTMLMLDEKPFVAADRLCGVDASDGLIKLQWLARLRSLTAARLAIDKKWDEAARESAANLRTAAHLAGRPLALCQWASFGMERDALAQLAAFLPHMSPAGLKTVQTTYRAAVVLPRATDEQVSWAENLWIWDTMELYHEWARDEARHPALREFLGSMLTLGETLKHDLGEGSTGLKLEERAFESVDALKAELLKSDAMTAWKVYQDQEASYQAWSDQPLPGALALREKMVARWREIGQGDPLTRFLDAIGIVDVGAHRLRLANRDVQRAGFEVLLALHLFKAEKNAWPEKLEELTPKLIVRLPKDPYSGKPLIYRRSADGADFKLYSVGEDQKDEGGTRDEAGKGDLVFWPLQTPEFTQP